MVGIWDSKPYRMKCVKKGGANKDYEDMKDANLVGDLPANFATYEKQAGTWDAVGKIHNMLNTETNAVLVVNDITTAPFAYSTKTFDPAFKTKAELEADRKAAEAAAAEKIKASIAASLKKNLGNM